MKTVVGELKKKKGLNWWVIVCPFCGKNHWVPAGNYAQNPVDFLGPRKITCLGRLAITVTIESRCRVCGCTDSHACPGGCHWVEPNLCSRCEGEE